jgi:glycosyltransferase involved in cell wall biosynthesis
MLCIQKSFITINQQWGQFNTWQKLLYTKSLTAIFYHPDGSYFYSLAPRNYCLLQVPQEKLLGPKTFWNNLKFQSWTPIYNSYFTKRFFQRIYTKRPKIDFVLYPTINQPVKFSAGKEKLIISVGRFFPHLHSKKQEVLIKAFNWAQSQYPEFVDYQLILIGSYKKEDAAYFNYLQKLAQSNPKIIFEINPLQTKLQDFYNRSQFYWHAAGYGFTEKDYPEKMEHFGIAIVEAMSYGAVPIVYQGGGPKETILSEKTGFFFQKRKELVKSTRRLINQPQLWQEFSTKAQARATDRFGEKAFLKSLTNLLPGKI